MMTVTTTSPHLTDDEVRDICAGLTQSAAMVRYLRDELGIKVVRRKPNGMPLVSRQVLARALGETPAASARQAAEEPNWGSLRAVPGGRT